MPSYIIATEAQAKAIGGNNYPITNNLEVTKARAVYLGCSIRTDLSPNNDDN
jgi:hypothetical protein